MIKKNKLILDSLKKGLIASCQPIPNGPMDSSSIILALARSSIIGGATGLRIENKKNINLVKNNTKVPIIGLIKRNLKNYPIIISPYLSDIAMIAKAGADIIAFDATNRKRPESVINIINEIKKFNKISMADCSSINDVFNAIESGVDIIGTTLSGYTKNKVPKYPDFNLLKKAISLGKPVIAEGRFNTPYLAKKAIKMGAHSVVVGTALNRIEIITNNFVKTIDE
tara:strand:- start:1685 stop:2362 length:678 start_codon:yes stop_codon:yes gene_type:complete